MYGDKIENSIIIVDNAESLMRIQQIKDSDISKYLDIKVHKTTYFPFASEFIQNKR